MNKAAIIVKGIGKQYKIGQRENFDKTFRETIMNVFASPLKRLRTLGEKSSGDDLFWALREVSFEVQYGEVVGIIGFNGAGKSTLLKILSRVTEPTFGQAIIRGRVGSLLEVGTGFHRELTGRENIYLNGAILGMKKAEIDSKFDKIVAFSEVEEFLDTPVKRYSSGMYVRLAFAVAAHLDPEILIIDEVLSVGDVRFQKKCIGKMRGVAGEGKTVLFVSHNMYSVRQLCTRAILIEHGRIAMDGPVDDVVDHYLQNNYAEKGKVILDNWNGTRKSPGTARISAVRTLNEQGQVCTGFGIGESITFEADLDNLPANGFVISFAIKNKQGTFVYHIRSQDSELVTSTSDSSATVRMTIGQIRLVEGTYYVNIWLGNYLNQLEDIVDSALVFSVLNRGHSVSQLLSVIHETGQWELVQTDPLQRNGQFVSE